jgi:hypothetical protein
MSRKLFLVSSNFVILLVAGTWLSDCQLAHAGEPARTKVSEAELRALLAAIPEVKIGEIGMPKRPAAGAKASVPEFQMSARYLTTRPDLAGLPMRMGEECKLDEKQAEMMTRLARGLRVIIGVTREGCDDDAEAVAMVLREDFKRFREAKEDQFPDFETVRLFQQHYAIPTLMQMLTGEGAPVRLVLVEQIEQIRGWTASQALARLAVYDLSPEVRAAALKALTARARDEYRGVLLDGLRYPWMPVVSNATEALVAVKDDKTIAVLEKLAEEPDPSLPFRAPRPRATAFPAGHPTAAAADQELGTHVVREVVRINHLSNCMLCHAQWEGSGSVRGVVPVPGEPLPPATQYYAKGDVFVRADTTYLRQDFSVAQPVKDHGAWPKMQRFDFVVRTRAATEEDLRRKPNPAYRETILHALAALKSEKAVTRK